VAHQPREVGAVCLHHRVVVVTHQAVRIGRRLKAIQRFGEHSQPFAAIGIVLEDRLAPVASRGDMVERAFEFQSQGAGHSRMVARNRQKARPDTFPGALDPAPWCRALIVTPFSL
jgi:hypothetical protein